MADEIATIDDYIASYPADVQRVLEEIRRTIREAVPTAGEKIAYKMPTITLGGTSLVHFAAWKQHIGMYSNATSDAAFERELDPYRQPGGTLRFRLDEPVPYDLIARLAALLAADHHAS